MTDDELIERALDVLSSRIKKPKDYFTSSKDTKNYLALKYGQMEHESFNVMFLDCKHGLLSLKEMFRGTINSAAVHSREIAKEALEFNAAAVVLSHNHPSGNCTPSAGDQLITHKIKNTLQLIDVKVLDHIIVGGSSTYSMAEHGMV